MSTVVNIICPLCNDSVNKLLYPFHADSERLVIGRIKEQHPAWLENSGLCSRCMDYYRTEIVMQQRILPEIGPYFSIKSADDFIILPTGLRLNADPRFTGKGITICFIDSGFYPHPDLIMHRNRVKTIIDITKEPSNSGCIPNDQVQMQVAHDSYEEDNSRWHGTMTSVVCAGDGYCSNGLYKGIASDAELVFVKVQDKAGKITTASIVAALQWVAVNHKKYGIRIVNMSLGDDTAVPFKSSEIDQMAEQLIENGIVIVAAVGNDENAAIKPPANSPNVIAVGGIDDDNRLDAPPGKLYHSSFGKTMDELMKPELLAHSIWIAAPILPGTKAAMEATILYRLLSQNDAELPAALAAGYSQIKLNSQLCGSNDVPFIRQTIVRRIQEAKYISAAYMHVDGTSFAAPIVSAVIAQLLEANPQLTPGSVRTILFSTAKRIDNQAAERQGFGVIQPRKAIIKVLNREAIAKPQVSPYINQQENCIEFYLQHDCAYQVSLAGNFNNWAPDVWLLEPEKNGLWKIAIPMLPAGRYLYKFFVDDKNWQEDIGNPYKEPDGFFGFNSILIVNP